MTSLRARLLSTVIRVPKAEMFADWLSQGARLSRVPPQIRPVPPGSARFRPGSTPDPPRLQPLNL